VSVLDAFIMGPRSGNDNGQVSDDGQASDERDKAAATSEDTREYSDSEPIYGSVKRPRKECRCHSDDTPTLLGKR
jgi:hypothetical protein